MTIESSAAGGFAGNGGTAALITQAKPVFTMKIRTSNKTNATPFILVLAVLLLSPYVATARNVHLEPANMKSSIKVIAAYRDSLLPLIYSGFTDKPAARYTVLPSFSGEYAWSLEQQGNDEHFIVINKLKENFWYTRDSSMLTTRVTISRSLYDAIAGMFAVAVGQTRKADEDTGILDGVSYYLSATGKYGALRTGKTQSPERGSLMRRLVDICDEISEMRGDGATDEAGLEKKINALVLELQK